MVGSKAKKPRKATSPRSLIRGIPVVTNSPPPGAGSPALAMARIFPVAGVAPATVGRVSPPAPWMNPPLDKPPATVIELYVSRPLCCSKSTSRPVNPFIGS